MEPNSAEGACNKTNPEIDNWKEIQEDLRKKVIRFDTEEWQQDFGKLKYIAGLDISTPKDGQLNEKGHSKAYTAIAIFSYPELEVVHQEVQAVTLDVAYVPGFLAFREAPAICELVEKVITEKPNIRPDVLLIDGNGLLHPQRCGLACHIGLRTNIPTIGVAKNLFILEELNIQKKGDVQGMQKSGDFTNLTSSTDSDEVLGMALKTSDACNNPIFVSIGHKISLDTARKVVLAVSRYRVPDPVRVADHISREAIAAIQKTQTS